MSYENTVCPCGDKKPTDNMSKPTLKRILTGLKYIADSPDEAKGGFNPTTIQVAKDAYAKMVDLRYALLLYHEAWNGNERDWHRAMREASHNAEQVLWK